ncbi:MAG: hypothetical protein AABZ14_06040 [Candidatus Margulisiibacteriota bacterium]
MDSKNSETKSFAQMALKVFYYGAHDTAAVPGGLFDEMQLSERERQLAKRVYYDKQGNPIRRDDAEYFMVAFQDVYEEVTAERFGRLSIDLLADEIRTRALEFIYG